jgi:hypothetical protein
LDASPPGSCIGWRTFKVRISAKREGNSKS